MAFGVLNGDLVHAALELAGHKSVPADYNWPILVFIDDRSNSFSRAVLRAEQNIAAFRQFFNVQYREGRAGFDLDFVNRKEAPGHDNFGSERRDRVYDNSNVLFEIIWPAVKERLAQEFKAKRPLHKIWH